MNELILSIVTVTKDCVGTIGRTLDSVEAVKQLGVEYVVVDGKSTDGTLEVIRSRGALVDRLISETDSGVYNAMNKAVGLARGRYILFINGDDELVASGFPVVMNALRQDVSEIVCAVTLAGEVDAPDVTLIAKPWRLPFFNAIPHPSSFVRRELLIRNPFREDLRIVSDYDFFLCAYLRGQKFWTLPVVTALHRQGGISSDVHRSEMEIDKVRRARLGWKYYFFNVSHAGYKMCKKLIGAA